MTLGVGLHGLMLKKTSVMGSGSLDDLATESCSGFKVDYSSLHLFLFLEIK